MWGLGVPDAHTIPSELAALIKGRNVEIVNYGEQGFVTTQSYMQLLLNLRRGERPNLVVFYDGYNDLLVPTFGSKAGLPHNEARRVTEFKLSLKEERFRTYLQALKFAYGRSLSWAESAGRSINPAAPVKLSTVEIWRAGKEVIDAYAFNLDLVRDLGRSFGFKPLFFLQPIRGVDPAKPPAPGEAASIFQAGYHVAHQRFPASRDVIFLDEVLKGGPNVYLDDAHLSHLGNRTVAREMLNSIEPLLP
jgi:lysophospholipase L1-like esterase